MRDAHRMKEKYDVSLDNRQIVSLLIGSIVVLGAVFVLGVVVGKSLAGTQTGADAPDLLSALDAKAAAMKREPIDPPLTFQDELTEKKSLTPAPHVVAPVVVIDPAENAKAEAARAEIVKAEAARLELAKSEAAKNEAAKTEAARVELAKAEAAKAEAAKTQAAKESGEAIAVNGQVAPTQVPTRTNDAGIGAAIARVSQKPQDTSAAGDWTLQLSASQSRDEADRFAARLRDRGYAPYITEAEVAGKGTWFRVRMGRFGSKDAAQRYLQDFRRETQLDAFVASVQ